LSSYEATLGNTIRPVTRGAGFIHGTYAYLFLYNWITIALDQFPTEGNRAVLAVTQFERPNTLLVHFRFSAGIVPEQDAAISPNTEQYLLVINAFRYGANLYFIGDNGLTKAGGRGFALFKRAKSAADSGEYAVVQDFHF
jgi:hypothetical protein